MQIQRDRQSSADLAGDLQGLVVAAAAQPGAVQGHRQNDLGSLCPLLQQGQGQALPEQAGQVEAGMELDPAHQGGDRVLVTEGGMAGGEGRRAALAGAAQGPGGLARGEGDGATRAGGAVVGQVGAAAGTEVQPRVTGGPAQDAGRGVQVCQEPVQPGRCHVSVKSLRSAGWASISAGLPSLAKSEGSPGCSSMSSFMPIPVPGSAPSCARGVLEPSLTEGEPELIVGVEEDLVDDAMADALDGFYDEMFALDQGLYEHAAEASPDDYQTAGVVVNLQDGRAVYADIPPDILGQGDAGPDAAGAVGPGQRHRHRRGAPGPAQPLPAPPRRRRRAGLTPFAVLGVA